MISSLLTWSLIANNPIHWWKFHVCTPGAAGRHRHQHYRGAGGDRVVGPKVEFAAVLWIWIREGSQKFVGNSPQNRPKLLEYNFQFCFKEITFFQYTWTISSLIELESKGFNILIEKNLNKSLTFFASVILRNGSADP